MRRYAIHVFLADGSRRVMAGLFATDWDAIDAAIVAYPQTIAVVPRRAK